MKINILVILVCLMQAATAPAQTPGKTASSGKTPIRVEIRAQGGNYTIYRDNKPYFIRGAGGTRYPDRILAYGGNSMRTWDTRNAGAILDSAQKYGLTVLLGLDVARERHGFNYDDTVAVRKQLETLRAEVMKYKDHPALLAWGIGNELNLFYKNPGVWYAVNEISKMIHSLDKEHPTSTVLAGVNKELVGYLNERSPDLDLLGVNTYADLAVLPREIKESGWTKAYMVTEWGPTGHWECLQTTWKIPVEESSSEKAAVYKMRYEYGVAADPAHCVGSYVFLWGQKQERTPTWYGMFTEQGEESEVIDVMQFLWSGNWPQNKAPHIYSFQLGGRRSTDNIQLKAGDALPALAVVNDPDQDRLSYRFEVLPDPTETSEGGDFERRPQPQAGAVKPGANGSCTMNTPTKPGPYRLFVYATDGHGNVATSNIPFLVIN